jgi:hypothetical protein
MAAMLRISWPLAIVIALCIFAIARRPRLLEPIVVVFAVWFVWQLVLSRKRRGGPPGQEGLRRGRR